MWTMTCKLDGFYLITFDVCCLLVLGFKYKHFIEIINQIRHAYLIAFYRAYTYPGIKCTYLEDNH